ncbi:polyphosphate kinase 2 family protein [Deinococcus yavapaiensis]|uniref:Polyphosphate:AMP phosphotransferase n=1 Tax=Deinococcus yavapaiensis KR-236 TaxID=694435 RepID=A0A318S1C1_9DEIO|nr:polyphosphate kinase 2 family protein [Deinococcus yavapaiensis]PYE49943.1 polyphosphate:AMP phosphotransferase [Deinococcus yavapaiensis KR-236]
MSSERVKPDERANLRKRDPNERGAYAGEDGKARAREETRVLVARLAEWQERLYAEGRQALLVVLQAMDAGGKDGAVKHVMSGVNPAGVTVTSFKRPTDEEARHDFLWRVHAKTPPRGTIGLFNRSHYEDVLVPRVHGTLDEEALRQRVEAIRDFERHLAREGTTIVKFFLHISKEEQRERLQARVDDPEKRWKFQLGDLDERERWDDYQAAYDDLIGDTSAEHAPWYVIPANRKWYRDLVVARVLVETLERMNPRFPKEPEGVDWGTLRVK